MDQEWERRSREFKEWLNSPEFAAHIQKCKEEIEQKIGYGDCFTIDEFIEEIQQGSINGYDGIGYFYDAIQDQETNIPVRMDPRWLKEHGLWFTHVMWYNK